MKTDTRRALIPGWFALMIAASLAVVLFGAFHKDEPKAAAPSELLDCLWIDALPVKETDPFKAYMFTSDNVGLHVDGHSAFKITLEIFEFRASAKQITYAFPHDGRKATTTFVIEKMKKPTRQFDTQLTIKEDPQEGGKSKVYYTGPELRQGLDTLDTLPLPLREALSATRTR